MERETGIEPATFSLGSCHSTAELLPLSGQLGILAPVLVLFRFADNREYFIPLDFHFTFCRSFEVKPN